MPVDKEPSIAKRVFDWIDEHIALFVIIGLLSLVALALRQTSDETKTCQVQSRGLKAQKHLTQILAAFNVFVQPPQGPNAKGLPKQPPIPVYYTYSVKALRYHLPLYLILEAEQPNGRHC